MSKVKVINILLSKPQKNYLLRNLNKLIQSPKNSEQSKEIMSALLFKINSGENLVRLNTGQSNVVRLLSSKSIEILKNKVIPEYEKRGKPEHKSYIRKATKTLKELENLLNKIERKLHG